MAGPERHRSLDMLTEEGAKSLRERHGVADVVADHVWLATFVAGLVPATITACGLLLGGVSVGWSLVAGGAVLVVMVGLLALASRLLGRPAVTELFAEENPPAELLEGVRWDNEVEAATAARGRNLEGPGASYWIEVELEPGVWAIERRRYRRSGDEGGGGNGGDLGWFGDGGGGGNGGGS